MMTWIEDRIAQRNTKWEHNRLIDQSAEDIFNDLWEEIRKCVEEANQHQLKVSTNGMPYERIVSMAVKATSGQRASQSLTILLQKPTHAISVSGLLPAVHLSIEVCPDGVVCLKYDDKRITLKDAAKLILDPFLFPDLQPTT